MRRMLFAGTLKFIQPVCRLNSFTTDRSHPSVRRKCRHAVSCMAHSIISNLGTCAPAEWPGMAARCHTEAVHFAMDRYLEQFANIGLFQQTSTLDVSSLRAPEWPLRFVRIMHVLYPVSRKARSSSKILCEPVRWNL
jgi:hypothetical protein